MDWSPQQEHALAEVSRWLRDADRQVFRLWGYAGTGKTTLARHFAEGVGGRVLFAAFTGKAADVMRRNGCPEATTIHRLIYRPIERNKNRLLELEQELEKYPEVTVQNALTGGIALHVSCARRLQLLREIDAEKKRVGRPFFELNLDSTVRGASLLILDEASMIDARIGEDLIGFGTPILVLGDPFQLPPVRGQGYFTSGDPDVALTAVRRQALDNPVLALATGVREGRGLPLGTFGESRVCSRGEFDRDSLSNEVQILVGKNDTRRRANFRRREAMGLPPGEPTAGDRLVCLRNDHEVGLLNGGIWSVTEAFQIEPNFYEMVIRDGDQTLGVRAHAGIFRGEDVPLFSRRDAQEFDFGYALTVHKAQGSQWPEVLVVDESFCFRADADRWLYTALTRAEKKVTVVK